MVLLAASLLLGGLLSRFGQRPLVGYLILLGINVLVALFDSEYVHHEPAHRRFASIGDPSWATCPITESGFVRAVSNPAYPTVSASPDVATERLRVLCGKAGYEFWRVLAGRCFADRFPVSEVARGRLPK